MKQLDWKDVLCSETPAPKDKVPASWNDYPIDPFEQDYKEIISSVSFRRLQDKTQVYQLDKGDFVRTRLTHSIETSTVAKQLGIMVTDNRKKYGGESFKKDAELCCRAIPSVLACAGLLHDLGNPPFGHDGEHSIQIWFQKHFADDSFTFYGKPVRDWLTEQMRADLCHFEGNAQNIRILSKARYAFENQEANISYAVISSLIKYPIRSTEADPENADIRLHKFGYYLSEQNFAKTVREKTGVAFLEQPQARNPLTFLLEAADDIAYAAADLDDAVVKKVITPKQFASYMRDCLDRIPDDGSEWQQLQKMSTESLYTALMAKLDVCPILDSASEIAAFQQWINYARSWLMYVAAYGFAVHEQEIMAGTFCGDLFEDTHHKYTLEIMKNAVRNFVHPKLAPCTAAASLLLSYLLDKFTGAVLYWDTDTKLTTADIAFLRCIPEKHRLEYNAAKTGDPSYDLYLRFLMVTDYISTMTDRHAHEVYKQFNGIL